MTDPKITPLPPYYQPEELSGYLITRELFEDLQREVIAYSISFDNMTAELKDVREARDALLDEKLIEEPLRRRISELTADHDALKTATNALLHQIDIGDFVDSNGHSAKMLKAVHDLIAKLAAPGAQPRELAEQERDDIAEVNHAQWLALENVRLLAARHRTEDWAKHMLRFVDEAGTNKAQITREQVARAQHLAEQALAELVACKDLKERAEALHFAGLQSEFGDQWEEEYKKLRAEYIQRQPKAWDAARAILAAARSAK